jgi:hypothetical protein
MPRLCTICEHPEVDRIDAAIRAKQSQDYVAKWYHVTRDAIGRHVRSGHMIRTEPRPASSDARPLSAIREESSNTVEKLRDLVLVARGILDSAVGTNQLGTALGAIRELARVHELLAKLTGELDESTRVNVLVQQQQQRDQEQQLMLERLSIPERHELRRLITKAQGEDTAANGTAIETR